MRRPTGLAIAAALLVACTTNPLATSTAPVASAVAPTAATVGPTTTPARSAVPSPSTGPSLPRTSWDQVFTLQHGYLGDLITFRNGLLATGCILDASDNCSQKVVVVSSDGAAWEQIEVNVPGNLSFGSVHRVGRRLFALGYADTRKFGGATVLTSLDGRSWTRIRSASFRARAIRDVIKTPLGTFAIGYEAPPGSDNTSGFVIWPVRADGSFGESRVIDTGGDPHLISGAKWTGDEFVAWGLRNGPYTGPTIVLASRDGIDWSVRARVPGSRATVVEDIVVTGDRLVAVGYEGRRFPLMARAWTSDDAGRTWALANVGDDDARMATVDVEGGRLIARGSESFDSDQRPLSWVSSDGSAWTRLADDDDMPLLIGFRGTSPTTLGDRMCVAGWFYQGIPVGGAIYCR